MPTYDYMCKECGKMFEQFLPVSKRSNPEHKPCPSCDVRGHVVQCFTKIMQTTTMADKTKKIDGGMKEVFQRISKANPGNTMKF